MTQAGTNISVFAQVSMLNRMHFRYHDAFFLQSIISLVKVELNTECLIPYDCGFGMEVIFLA